MIRLLFLFIIFVFLSLPTYYNLGEVILKKIKVNFNNYLTMVIGFISIIGVFQLVYYPAMILQLPSLYITISGSIIVILFLILDVKKISNFKKIYLDKYIWVILFLTCIIFFIYMRTMPSDFWYFDDAFYFPFMYENASTSKLLSVEPRSGETISKIGNIYASQGYYMIGSYIISLYNIFKDFLSLKYNYMANIYYFMSFPSFLIMIFTGIGMSKQICLKYWERVLFISLYVFSIVFLSIDSNLLNNILTTGYIGVFLVLNVFIPFLIFLIYGYINGKKKYVYLISILFLSMLSCASFNIFIIFIVLYTLLFILYILKKEKHINDFLIMLFPSFLFLADFIIPNNIISFICEIMILIIYYFIYKFNDKLLKYEKYIFDKVKYLVYIFPFILILLSFVLILLKISIKCSTIDYLENIINALFPVFGTNSFHYSYVIITMFNIIFLILFSYLIIFRDKKTNIIILYVFIIIGVFLNPFSISFISTSLTSETYNRIYVLVLNPFIYYHIFKYFLEKINNKKLISGLSIMAIAICILVQLKEFQYWVNINGRSNKLYRLRDRDVVASLKLDDYARTNKIKDIKIATVHSELKMFNPDIFSLLDRTLEYIPNDRFTKKAFYISTIYNLNKGIIKQEYFKEYDVSLTDILRELEINFITIDIDCPVLNEQNISPNVLCKVPNKASYITKEQYIEVLNDYEEDLEIYNDFIKNLELVYQTDRYKLYYIKVGETLEAKNK